MNGSDLTRPASPHRLTFARRVSLGVVRIECERCGRDVLLALATCERPAGLLAAMPLGSLI